MAAPNSPVPVKGFLLGGGEKNLHARHVAGLRRADASPRVWSEREILPTIAVAILRATARISRFQAQGRVAESGLRHTTRNRATPKASVGSNPTPSATFEIMS